MYYPLYVHMYDTVYLLKFRPSKVSAPPKNVDGSLLKMTNRFNSNISSSFIGFHHPIE